MVGALLGMVVGLVLGAETAQQETTEFQVTSAGSDLRQEPVEFTPHR